jgi:hypothetical protein
MTKYIGDDDAHFNLTKGKVHGDECRPSIRYRVGTRLVRGKGTLIVCQCSPTPQQQSESLIQHAVSLACQSIPRICFAKAMSSSSDGIGRALLPSSAPLPPAAAEAAASLTGTPQGSVALPRGVWYVLLYSSHDDDTVPFAAAVQSKLPGRSPEKRCASTAGRCESENVRVPERE